MISKLIFCIISPLTQSFRNHSDLLLKIKHVLLLLCWKQVRRILMNKVRRTAFIWNKDNIIFCCIINVFIITFDQFKASLLNKSINFYNSFFHICICVCITVLYYTNNISVPSLLKWWLHPWCIAYIQWLDKIMWTPIIIVVNIICVLVKKQMMPLSFSSLYSLVLM